MNHNNHSEKPAGNFQAVIFDLDGVLMDSEWLSFQVWQDLIASRGGSLPDEMFPGLIGLTAEETAVQVRRTTGVDVEAPETIAGIWQQIIGRIQAGIEPLPGARPLVQSLASRGYKLAVASNSPTDYVRASLEGLGLLPYFPIQVGVELVAQGKPAPDVYLEAARRLETAPERCLAVEDSRVGVQAALRAGMRVLAVPAKQDHPMHFQSAWAIYDSLVEVHAALDEVLVG